MASIQDLKELRANNTSKTVMVTFLGNLVRPLSRNIPTSSKPTCSTAAATSTWLPANNPDEKDAVPKFLQKETARIADLQFGSAVGSAMQAAFNPRTRTVQAPLHRRPRTGGEGGLQTDRGGAHTGTQSRNSC